MALHVELERLDLCGSWKYKFKQETEDKCMICRQNIMAITPEDIKKKYLLSNILIGKCGHAFHKSCMTQYKKLNVSCPIDFTEWVVEHELKKYNDDIQVNS